MLQQEVAKVTDQKMHLVLDNHTAHKSILHGTKEYLEENFIVHWMPPGSPQLNSIETYWGVYKTKFRKLLQVNPKVRWSQDDFEERVRQAGNSIGEEETQNLLRANHGFMLQLLERFPEEDYPTQSE